jgi:Phage integrase family
MLIATARKRGRYGHRDATMILLAYRHGLRVGELCALRWDQVDFSQGFLHVARLKHGVPSVHPLAGEELHALRGLRREQSEGRHVFQSERDAPMTPGGFRKTLARIAASPLAFPSIRTCYGTPAASSWQTMGRTREHYSITSGTGTFSTRCVIPSWPPIASRASGPIDGARCDGPPAAITARRHCPIITASAVAVAVMTPIHDRVDVNYDNWHFGVTS